MRRLRIVVDSGFDVACYNPLNGYRDASGAIRFSARKGTDAEVTVPCGVCIGCRISRSRMWALRIVHESKLWDRNCFVTLSYDDVALPPHGSLRYRDVQLFHKKLRKAHGAFRFLLWVSTASCCSDRITTFAISAISRRTRSASGPFRTKYAAYSSSLLRTCGAEV